MICNSFPCQPSLLEAESKNNIICINWNIYTHIRIVFGNPYCDFSIFQGQMYLCSPIDKIEQIF